MVRGFVLRLVTSVVEWKLVQMVNPLRRTSSWFEFRLSATSAFAERSDRERLCELVEGGHYARGSMLVAHIAEGDDVLAWLAGALARFGAPGVGVRGRSASDVGSGEKDERQ